MAFVEAAVGYQSSMEEIRKTATSLVQSSVSLFCMTNIIRHFSRRLKCPLSEDQISPLEGGVCFYI